MYMCVCICVCASDFVNPVAARSFRVVVVRGCGKCAARGAGWLFVQVTQFLADEADDVCASAFERTLAKLGVALLINITIIVV